MKCKIESLLKIEIEDSGMGMDEETLNKIFIPYNTFQ